MEGDDEVDYTDFVLKNMHTLARLEVSGLAAKMGVEKEVVEKVVDQYFVEEKINRSPEVRQLLRKQKGKQETKGTEDATIDKKKILVLENDLFKALDYMSWTRNLSFDQISSRLNVTRISLEAHISLFFKFRILLGYGDGDEVDEPLETIIDSPSETEKDVKKNKNDPECKKSAARNPSLPPTEPVMDTSVFVTGVRKNTKLQQLRTIFTRFGKIKADGGVRIVKRQEAAIINFMDYHSKQKAIEELLIPTDCGLLKIEERKHVIMEEAEAAFDRVKGEGYGVKRLSCERDTDCGLLKIEERKHVIMEAAKAAFDRVKGEGYGVKRLSCERDIFGTENEILIEIVPKDLVPLFTHDYLDVSMVEWFTMSLKRSSLNSKNYNFLSPQMIQESSCLSNATDVQKYLKMALTDNEAFKAYIAPYYARKHWTLFVLFPHEETWLILDSKNADAFYHETNPFCSKEMLDAIRDKMRRSYKLTEMVEQNAFHLKFIVCNQENEDQDSGYYIMRWMKKILETEQFELFYWSGEFGGRDAFSKEEVADVISLCIQLCELGGTSEALLAPSMSDMGSQENDRNDTRNDICDNDSSLRNDTEDFESDEDEDPSYTTLEGKEYVVEYMDITEYNAELTKTDAKISDHTDIPEAAVVAYTQLKASTEPNRSKLVRVKANLLCTKEEFYILLHPADFMSLFRRDWLNVSILELFSRSLKKKANSKCNFLAPQFIQEVLCNRMPNDVLNYLKMALTDDKTYLAPYFISGRRHWALFVLYPKENRGSILDSCGGGSPHSYSLTNILKKVFPRMDIQLLKCNKQRGGWECGYYVMKWMQMIEQGELPTTEEPFELKEVNDIICYCIRLCKISKYLV